MPPAMPNRTSWPNIPGSRSLSYRGSKAATVPFPGAVRRRNAAMGQREAILQLKGFGGFRLDRELDQHWRAWMLVAWAAVVVWSLIQRQGNIAWLMLGDTDDNMRLMQVRGLLAGQG